MAPTATDGENGGSAAGADGRKLIPSPADNYNKKTVEPQVINDVSDGAAAAPDDETCDPRAKTIRQFFTFTREVLEPLVRVFSAFSGGGDQRHLEVMEEIGSGKGLPAPAPESAEYRSFNFLLDKRVELSGSNPTQENYALEVSVLASKFAYENRIVAGKLVQDNLQGTDYRFFNCRNVFFAEKTTQAIGFLREEGQRTTIIYVAFRGSEISAGDWETNVDCAQIWIGSGDRSYGKVHKGFMKALGLLSDTGDFDADFPRTLPPEHRRDPPAYYQIQTWFYDMYRKLQAEPQWQRPTEVVLRVVGHSQGGALAILFAAVLLYHRYKNPDVTPLRDVDRLEVITMGQPRVGDSDFAEWMTADFLQYHGTAPAPAPLPVVYKRMVYRTDPVARLPYDDDPQRKTCFSSYRHFGTCLYYLGWENKYTYEGDEPMPFEEVDVRNLDGWAQAADDLKKWVAMNKKMASFMETAGRFTLWPVLFHSLTSYLNAAVHGVDRNGPRRTSTTRGGGGALLLLRLLLRGLLHYPRKLLPDEQKKREKDKKKKKAPGSSCCS